MGDPTLVFYPFPNFDGDYNEVYSQYVDKIIIKMFTSSFDTAPPPQCLRIGGDEHNFMFHHILNNGQGHKNGLKWSQHNVIFFSTYQQRKTTYCISIMSSIANEIVQGPNFLPGTHALIMCLIEKIFIQATCT